MEAIGPNARVAPGVEVGGRVTVFPQPRAWSQWIVADTEVTVAAPDKLSAEVAAQMRRLLLRWLGGAGPWTCTPTWQPVGSSSTSRSTPPSTSRLGPY